MKKYLNLAENPNAKVNANVLEVEVYYSLGGMNYWTGREEKRGYYLGVSPLEKRGNMIEYVGFSGIKQCIKPVARKSAKAEAEAEKLAAQYEENLINYVLQQNNLQLAESEKIA